MVMFTRPGTPGVPIPCLFLGADPIRPMLRPKKKAGKATTMLRLCDVFFQLCSAKFVRNTLYTIKINKMCVSFFFVSRQKHTDLRSPLDHPLEFAATTAEPVRLHSLRECSRTSRGILKF